MRRPTSRRQTAGIGGRTPTGRWHPRHWSLATKIWIVVLSSILLASAILLGISIRFTRDRLRGEVQEAFAMAAHSNLASVAESLSRAFAVLRGIAADEVIVETARAGAQIEVVTEADQVTVGQLQDAWSAAADDSPMVQSVVNRQLNPAAAQLRRHLAGLPDFVDVWVTDQVGIVVAATRRPEAISQAAMPWWSSAYNEAQGSQYAGLYRRVGEPTAYQYFEMAVPIYGDPVSRTDLVGVVYARLNLSYLVGAFAEARPSTAVPNTAGTEVLIIDQQGQVIVATQAELVGSLVDSSWWQRAYAEALTRRRYVHEAVGPDGEPVLLGHASLPYLHIDRAGTYHRSEDAAVLNDMGWILYVYEPLRTAYAAGMSTAMIWGWGGGAILLVLGLAYALSRMLVSPLDHLLSFVQSAIDGNAVPQTRVYAQRELSLLAENFRRLLAAREGLQETLLEREDALTQVHAGRRTEITLLSAIGDLIAVSTQVDDLTQQAVEMVRSRYSLYYVGLYLVNYHDRDEEVSDAVGSSSRRQPTSPQGQRWAVLQAGTGEQGRLLLAQGHRVSADSGIVSRCLSSGEAQVVVNDHPQPGQASARTIVAAVDVGGDSDEDDGSVNAGMVSSPLRLGDPSRRYVRSEIVAPLRFRGTVTGILLAQSYKADTFDEAFVEVFQILADELAVAIESIRAYSERQEADERLQRAYGQLTRDAWQEMLGQRVGRGYEAAVTGAHALPPLDPQAWQELQQEAWETGELVVSSVQDDGGAQHRGGKQHRDGASLYRAVLPIRARGEVIGVLDVSRSAEAEDVGSEAGITADELSELEALAEQLGLALENARLYELARQRAMEEQMVGQITQRMRETLSVDAVLQTAATQLRELMSLSGVEIRVGAAEFDTAAPSGADMGWYFDTDGASGGDGRVADEPQGTDGSIPRSPGA